MPGATIPVSKSSDRSGPAKTRSGIGVKRSWPRRHVSSRTTPTCRFLDLSDDEAVFQFRLHTMPSEEAEHIGTSSIVAAWNAATYVAQIDEARLAEATSTGVYLDATRRVMQTHGGIWWNNERYVITRQ